MARTSDAGVWQRGFGLRVFQVMNIFVFYALPSLASGGQAAAGEAVSPSMRGASQQNGTAGVSTGHEAGADVYYATRMAEKFQKFAHKRKLATDAYHGEEQDRLEDAIGKARELKDKDLLTAAAIADEGTRIEEQNALNLMTNFMATLKQAMGARGSALSCDDLFCGNHAYCTVSALEGAQCNCEEGYEGTGFVCNPPRSLNMHALIRVQPNAPQPQVADLHVATFDGNRLGVAYRDVTRSHQGYLLIGRAGASEVDWDAPVLFSNQSMAFSPVLTALRDGSGFAVAFRDANLGGNGILLGGTYGPGNRTLALGPGKAFARHQAQAMAILPLSGSRVAVVFSEHVLGGSSGQLTGGAMYGAAMLAHVLPGTGEPPSFLAKHRFASGPVARISATLLSPTSLVVAFRLGDTGQPNQMAEASAIYGQVHGNKLVFDPHPMSLEPHVPQIWARSVAPIDHHTFSYTYHSGMEEVTKQAILRIDNVTHRMFPVQAPTVIGRGFTPYVFTASDLFFDASSGEASLRQETGPRLFTFYNRAGSSYPQGHMCKVTAEGLPASCRDVDWATPELISAGSAAVGDGRLMLVSTDAKGVPFYKLVGLMDA